MEYYHMRKRGCFELESIENLKEKIDELLAVIFKHRPVRKRDSDLFNAYFKASLHTSEQRNVVRVSLEFKSSGEERKHKQKMEKGSRPRTRSA